MTFFIRVNTAEQAKDQLLRLRKTAGEKQDSTGKVLAYIVDGKEYSAKELIQLANSVVCKTIPRNPVAISFAYYSNPF